MDIDEIKCALCGQLYNESERMPILLPDCGHSFCYTCIQGCFQLLKIGQDKKLIVNVLQCDCKKQGIVSQFEYKSTINNYQNFFLWIEFDEDGMVGMAKPTNHSAPLKKELQLNTSDDMLLNEGGAGEQRTPMKRSEAVVHHEGCSSIKRTHEIAHTPRLLFKCPEDDVECSIQNPDQLPRNYALLKIVQKSLESEADKSKKIVVLKYSEDRRKFVASKKEDKSLANFLTSPQKNPKKEEVAQQKAIMVETNNLDICKQHNRPNEVICVNDKIRVCTESKFQLEQKYLPATKQIQCALFGAHRGHDVRQEKDVAEEINLKAEVLMDMYLNMHQQCLDIQATPSFDRFYNLFKNRQAELKQQIHVQFKEWRKQLRAQEMKLIDQLYTQGFQPFEERFSNAVAANKRIVGDAQAWMETAKIHMDEYTQKIEKDPHYIAYSMLDRNEADAILENGEAVLDRNEKLKGYPSLIGLESLYSQVKVVFEPHFEKRITNLAQIIPYQAQQQQLQQTVETSGDFTTASQSFLPQLSFTNEEGCCERDSTLPGGLNISNISFNEPTSPINTVVQPPQIIENILKPSVVRVASRQMEEQKNTSSDSFENNQSLFEANMQSIQHQPLIRQGSLASGGGTGTLRRVSMINKIGMSSQQSVTPQSHSLQGEVAKHQLVANPPPGEKPPAKQPSGQFGVKKLDLPTIFKTQTSPTGELDLSNKNLGDMHAGDITKCLKHSMIRVLSLAKNRLTDEGVGQIVRAICDTSVEHLDLQGNKITEKSVDSIVGCLKTNKSLKVLDLSNNGMM